MSITEPFLTTQSQTSGLQTNAQTVGAANRAWRGNVCSWPAVTTNVAPMAAEAHAVNAPTAMTCA